MSKLNLDIFDRPPAKKLKPRVLVDLDGVVRDFIGSLTRVYLRENPGHVVKPVTSRKLEDFFPIGKEIYNFMASKLIDEIMIEAPAFDGAISALEQWSEIFEIVIVSAQPAQSRGPNYIWIGKHNLPTWEVHTTFYKSTVDGIALLDDFTHNLVEFAATGRPAVCLDQPWNQNWRGPRVFSVNEFFEYLYEAIDFNNIEQSEFKQMT